MSVHHLLAFLPETVVLLGALVLFVLCLGNDNARPARMASLLVALLGVGAALVSLGQEATLFSGAYRVDPFSQLLKLTLTVGYFLVVLAGGEIGDIRADIRPEYHLFLGLHVSGLLLLVSCIDLITLVVALELSAFPLYLMVPMRRERDEQRAQMESAMKYIMFGVAANGIMFFGMSYLFGLTGTTSLPHLFAALRPVSHSPLAVAGLAMTFCGLYYKLGVFPFHFWTPDVYQGAANETTALIASLPKLAAVAVLVRFVSLAAPDTRAIVILLTLLAGASMLYGNLIALAQQDLKRLFGFSGIAHAGYALVGFVSMDSAGYTAAIYYMVGYVFMVLACLVAVCRVSRDGLNVSIADLAGLHRRSPLLAMTVAGGAFALAGLPPFAGFMGKLTLLSAALAKGHLALVILTVVNSAIAIYYYLQIVREAYFNDPGERPVIPLDWDTRVLCVLLLVAIVVLGVAPGPFLQVVSSSLTYVNLPLGQLPPH